MDTTEKIWIDGKFVDWDDAKIHVLTHTLHYGLGVFEGIRFYESEKGPVIFRLKEHAERLIRSAEYCRMKVPYSSEQIAQAIKETVKINNVKSGYIRPIIYYGYGKMGLNPKGAETVCAIAVWPWGSYLGENAVKVKISKYIRIHPDSTHTEAKICGHYVNSILAHLDAENAGYDEALLLDHEGNIAEGPGENFFMVKDNILITPPLGNILAGITRDTIITIAKDMGYEIAEEHIRPDDLRDAQEVFFTGSAAEVTLIGSVNGEKVGTGVSEISAKLKEKYMDIVQGRNEKYNGWLTYVG